MNNFFVLLNGLTENIFQCLQPLYASGSAVGSWGNVPKRSSITPGKIYAGPKFQVIMLLDRHHEKQDFFPLFS